MIPIGKFPLREAKPSELTWGASRCSGRDSRVSFREHLGRNRAYRDVDDPALF